MTAKQGFAALTPAQRSLAAGIGALHNWSRKTSPEARREGMAPVNAGRRAKFAAIADPEGTLPADEREAAIDRLIAAHMRGLAIKSAQARAARRAAA